MSDSDESEDEEAELLTSRLDVQILRTLRAIKSGDKRVYDKNVSFFERNDDDGGDGREPPYLGGRQINDLLKRDIAIPTFILP